MTDGGLMAELALKGIMAHLIGDWLLQNDWMANGKGSLLRPAAWVHGAIHFVLLALFFPWPAALGLALLHVVIDTRAPLRWWARLYRKDTIWAPLEARSLWEDQALHLILIILGAWAVTLYMA